MKKISVFLAFVLFCMPILALAHQPRITESRLTTVPDPEVSKAYYGELTGEPDFYTIDAKEPFDLYVNILVPDIAGQKKDVLVDIILDQRGTEASGAWVMPLGNANFEWKKMFEPFGHDNYWQGPEYKNRVRAGKYDIRVSSPNNDSKYTLAIGEIEAFDMKEGLNAIKLIPQLKKDFFNKSPLGFIRSPFGWGLIVVMYILAGIVGLIYRALLKRFATGSVRSLNKNIGKPDRLIRLALGLGLLLLAMLTTWSPLLIFISGFCIFESLFSWCGFYAAIGKNTCPIE